MYSIICITYILKHNFIDSDGSGASNQLQEAPLPGHCPDSPRGFNNLQLHTQYINNNIVI